MWQKRLRSLTKYKFTSEPSLIHYTAWGKVELEHDAYSTVSSITYMS